MCGIFGYSGPRAVDETKVRLLAIENISRGRDSTGVYGNHLYKDNVDSRDFIRSNAFRAAIKGAKAVGGHTRAATFGAKTKPNAHPFAYGIGTEWYTVGAHNGFIVPEMLKVHCKDFGFKENEFDVDSMLIFAAVAKYKDVNIISKIEGGMALWFMFPEKDRDTIYLYKRNNTRDLHVGEANDGLYFSSLAEPLHLIGCDKVYATQGDMLYTLKHGEIIDRYTMPLPIVKSLGANVSRDKWRQGVPNAELNALPEDASIRRHHSASTNGTSSTQTNLYKDEDSKTSNLKSDLSSKYSGNHTSIDDALRKKSDDKNLAAFSLLMRSLQNELKSMERTVVEYWDTGAYEMDSWEGFILVAQLINADNKQPLEGWSLVSESDIDACGITCFNGVALIRVAASKLSKTPELELLIYDPTDELEPYVVKIPTKKSSVREVILSIPFRKEDKTQRNINSKIVGAGEMAASGGRLHECSIHLSRLSADTTDASAIGSNPKLLPIKAGGVHSGHEEQSSNGSSKVRGVASNLVPKTEGCPTGVKIEVNRCLPNKPLVEKIPTLKALLKRDSQGYYSGWKPIATVTQFMLKDPDMYIIKKYYEEQASKHQTYVINSTSLILDAARCRGWDMFTYHCYYDLALYVDMLLKTFPNWYLKHGTYMLGENGKPHIIPENFSPWKAMEEVKKRDQEPEIVDEPDRDIDYNFFIAWLMWLHNNNSINTVAKKKLKEYVASAIHAEVQYEEIIADINEGLQKDEQQGSHWQTHELRQAAQKARNFLIREKDDIVNFGKQCEARIKAIEHPFVEEHQFTEEGHRCDI